MDEHFGRGSIISNGATGGGNAKTPATTTIGWPRAEERERLILPVQLKESVDPGQVILIQLGQPGNKPRPYQSKGWNRGLKFIAPRPATGARNQGGRSVQKGRKDFMMGELAANHI